MICVLAMIVFGIMAIFSASHRPIAKEAFDCVFRRITLKKCKSGLDVRLKAKLIGKLMQKILNWLDRYTNILKLFHGCLL